MKDLKDQFINKYKVINSKKVEIERINDEENLREFFDSSYQGVKRLFVLAYDNIAGNNQVSVDPFKTAFILE